MRSLLCILLLVSAARAEEPSLVLPEAPRRVVDKKFVAASAYQAVATVLDVESTVAMQRRGLCKEGWSSWLVGEYPNRTKLYTTAVIGNAATAGLAYYLKKKGKRYWWVPQVTAGSVHGFAAGRNRFMLGCF